MDRTSVMEISNRVHKNIHLIREFDFPNQKIQIIKSEFWPKVEKY